MPPCIFVFFTSALTSMSRLSILFWEGSTLSLGITTRPDYLRTKTTIPTVVYLPRPLSTALVGFWGALLGISFRELQLFVCWIVLHSFQYLTLALLTLAEGMLFTCREPSLMMLHYFCEISPTILPILGSLCVCPARPAIKWCKIKIGGFGQSFATQAAPPFYSN